jgi:hypothetical protein
MKVQTITTNFTAGEQSPRLRGRVDLDKYNASAQELFNCFVFRQGGVSIRPPTRFIAEVKDSTKATRIVPFVFSRTDAYLLEMGENYMRVFKNGAAVGAPYEVVTPYLASQIGQVDYSQGADTMLAAHGSVPVQAIRRFADDQWTVAPATFKPAAVTEVGDRAAVTMTISNVAVGAGRTLTASGAFFLAADVGRTIEWAGGNATITAVGSGTSATATVNAAFGSASAVGTAGWVLNGTPQTTCTPSAASPLGAACTLTLSAAGWRSDAVGGVVELNGGLVRITAYSSTTVISGVIVKVLSGTTGAPADAWGLRKVAWNVDDGYPKAVTFYQQRTWLANTQRYPQTKWGSKSGLFFDFTPGVDDDSAIYKTLDTDEVNPIDYLRSSSSLISLTLGGEFETRGGIEKPVSQTNANITLRTRWGCDQVRPERVGSELLFVERGGKTLRALANESEGFSARDVSVFSEHLMRQGLRSMAYEQAPESVIWAATGDGKLLAITFNSEQNTVAFCSGDVGGNVEWVASVPDGTYLLVQRTINGVSKRYIEKLDWGDWTDTQVIRNAHDCRKEVTGAASTTWAGFGHLEGETVSVLADDIYVGDVEVTGGVITLPRTATKVSAGLPYVARIVQQPPEVSTGTGTSQGQAISTNKVQVRFFKTIGCQVNGQDLPFRAFDVPETLDQPLQPFSGIKEISTLGWAMGESTLTLEQRQPYPWTVLAVIREFTVNAG